MNIGLFWVHFGPIFGSKTMLKRYKGDRFRCFYDFLVFSGFGALFWANFRPGKNWKSIFWILQKRCFRKFRFFHRCLAQKPCSNAVRVVDFSVFETLSFFMFFPGFCVFRLGKKVKTVFFSFFFETKYQYRLGLGQFWADFAQTKICHGARTRLWLRRITTSSRARRSMLPNPNTEDWQFLCTIHSRLLPLPLEDNVPY